MCSAYHNYKWSRDEENSWEIDSFCAHYLLLYQYSWSAKTITCVYI